MDGAAALVLMLSAMTVLLAGVSSKARVCYFGPPPELDPDHPDHWMKQVMEKIRERCPGPVKRQPISADTGKPTKASTEKPGTADMGKLTPAGTAKPTSADTEKPTTAAECSTPGALGMEDGTIPDNRIRASSSRSSCCLATNARLNDDGYAWVAAGSDSSIDWIEVNLVESTVVSGVITQGGIFDDYVTSYKVDYQKQPSSGYRHVTDESGNIKVFTGNTDDHTPVTNLFDESVVATFFDISDPGARSTRSLSLASGRMDGAVRCLLVASALTALFVSVESKARTCYFGPPPEPDPDNPDHWMKQVMREIRERCPGTKESTPADGGCLTPKALGLEDRSITDNQIRSSMSAGGWSARQGRLNNNGAWIATSSSNARIEVNFVESVVLVVSGVITQGTQPPGTASPRYVKSYKVAYKKHPSPDYEYVTGGNGNITVFMGNTDANTPVTNLFDESVVAKVVRIEPTEWFIAVALRLELLGCRN
ncbi:lactadherin-like [Patiria miniata]|uniref:F5/8 type C domain-containing protein n=1 Tax=Patiria miniata TaxID=46514 RepID=A0A914AEA8_PATMI|nr:lactadherin-like [Patiria miniata]